MADNVPYVEDAAVSIAADEIAGAKYQRVKFVLGADGINDGDLARTNPMPALLVDAGGNPIDPRLIRAIASGTDSISVPGIDVNLSTRATEATLALIKAKTDNIDVALSTRTKPADQQHVIVDSSALPTGAATAALQTQPGVDIGDVTVNNAGGAAAVNIQDGGNSITVDGTVTANAGTNLNTSALAVESGGNLATIASAVRAEDSVAADLDKGIGFLAIRKATPANLSGADGDYEFPQMNAGRLWTSTTGDKTNNNVAPGATNFGALTGIANAALPTNTEGNLILPTCDLRGVWRVNAVPIDFLGVYRWQGITGGYTGLASGVPLCAWRWGDATRFGVLLRVRILVFSSTAATVAGLTERWLRVCRAFTASDTGGTQATLTGNNMKLRTSMPTTLITDLRIGAPLTAGTRTLDAAPHCSVGAWSGLLSTGMTIGAFGSSPVGAARSTEGGGQFQVLFDATTGQEAPLIFAQNEGVEIQIGAAMPTTVVQQTMVELTWGEANKVY